MTTPISYTSKVHRKGRVLPLDSNIISKIAASELDVAYNREEYFTNLDKFIKKEFERPRNSELSYNIFDTEEIKQDRIRALKTKQNDMKFGVILQEAIGS
jgi:hypothetical protein